MKLSNKEKVLQYILSREISASNEVFIGLNSYKSIEDITPKEFIQKVTALEQDKLLQAKFNGNRNERSPVTVILHSSALTYFEDKKKSKRDKIFKIMRMTTKDIVFMTTNAILSGIVAYIVATLTK